MTALGSDVGVKPIGETVYVAVAIALSLIPGLLAIALIVIVEVTVTAVVPLYPTEQSNTVLPAVVL